MTRNTITAIVGSILLVAAFGTASHADNPDDAAKPMIDDPMNIQAAGSTGGDPTRRSLGTIETKITPTAGTGIPSRTRLHQVFDRNNAAQLWTYDVPGTHCF